ncbi:MAG: endonuclease domain-containing protein [Armatimonadetes bacterium]|nr:endonuclease domain-containing protein [Armatimonadota bacterium]
MPGLQHHARRMRREQTDAERMLWSCLRSRRLEHAKFRRQFPVGPYIVDFCCMEQKLVIEIDGGQHAEQAEADSHRTAYLAKLGYRVLRFWDNEVLTNASGVLDCIVEALGPPHPRPLPDGRGGARGEP